jgi:hypothetical protein
MVDFVSGTESRSETSHRTSLAQSLLADGDLMIWPASECTGVVTRVESDAGREKRDEEKEVVELLKCMAGVVVERTPQFKFEKDD